MSIPKHISEFLDSQRVWYQHFTHSLAYTAQGIAHAQHISGKHLAKVVMVMAGGNLIMAVVPGNHRVDLQRLGEILNADSIRLAAEDEFKDIFPDCELGAMPPLGNLYKLDVWVDASLNSHPHMLFNAGSHSETILMSIADFDRLVQPKIGTFSVLMH
jgi:Ala-tRNA(Pro) deacylase